MALFAVVCCAVPALVAAGALGVIGVWLANPWVIGAGIVVLAASVAWIARRRTRASDSADCCSPREPGQPDLPQTKREDH